MRDFSYILKAEAVGEARPPFSYRFVAQRPTQRCWSVRDGGNREVGQAKTRNGARMAVHALYQAVRT